MATRPLIKEVEDRFIANEAAIVAVPKIRVARRWIWTGGAGTTITISVPGVTVTDVVAASISEQVGTSYVVSSVRSGTDEVLVTTSANMANDDVISLLVTQTVL